MTNYEKLKAAVEKYADEWMKEEIEYFTDEYEYDLAYALIRTEENAIEDGKRGAITRINNIYVELGILIPVTQEDFDNRHCFGGKYDRNKGFTRHKNQYWDSTLTHEQFEREYCDDQ